MTTKANGETSLAQAPQSSNAVTPRDHELERQPGLGRFGWARVGTPTRPGSIRVSASWHTNPA